MGKGHCIDHRWNAQGGAEFASVDPATGQEVWRGREAREAEVTQAAAAARCAFSHWGAAPLEQRVALLERFARQLQSGKAELIEAICRETGKPRWEAASEVDSMATKISISFEAYRDRRKETARSLDGATGTTRFRPHGVVTVLGPFNMPGHLPNGHIVPALLAGNTVVFKPSEKTPLVDEKMMETWLTAGLPAGVLNLVQGGRETGMALVQQGGIDGVFFTGSLAAGRAISRALADEPGKIVALEMGGNNPLIVHRAGDLDAAAYITIQSAFITAGQRCSCARRLIVVADDEGERFVQRLVEMMGKIKVGRYTDVPEPFMGPVISDATAEQLLAVQKTMQERGAQSLLEMRQVGQRKAMLSAGLIDVTRQRERADEEIFGPLLQLVRVKDFDAAIAEANATKYGLTAGLLSDERDLWEQFFLRIRAGVVNWNRPLTGASGYLPFGGVGRSGNNRPSAYFAADYCSYPVASMEVEKVAMPEDLVPGISI